MECRKFGNTGLTPSILGFGMMRLKKNEDGTINEQWAIETLRGAIDRGLTYVDTAYAYGDSEGDMRLGIGFDKDTNAITFRMADRGIPFDPLKKPDPDITRSAEEREIGGLGIFITKQTMDSVTYAYENGENILTMIKTM